MILFPFKNFIQMSKSLGIPYEQVKPCSVLKRDRGGSGGSSSGGGSGSGGGGSGRVPSARKLS